MHQPPVQCCIYQHVSREIRLFACAFFSGPHHKDILGRNQNFPELICKSFTLQRFYDVLLDFFLVSRESLQGIPLEFGVLYKFHFRSKNVSLG